MLSSAHLVHASRILGCRVVAEVQTEVLLGSPPDFVVPAVLLSSDHFHIKLPLRATYVTRLVTGSTVLQVAFCELLRTKQTELRTHQVFIKQTVSSPPAATDSSVPELGCPHFLVKDHGRK